jgi:hypothetical protein
MPPILLLIIICDSAPPSLLREEGALQKRNKKTHAWFVALVSSFGRVPYTPGGYQGGS